MEASRLFLSSTIKEKICSNLNFEDVVQLRDALELSSLKCPISVNDPKSSKKIILPGVNSTTIATYQLIKQYGLNKAFRKAAKNGQNSVVQTLINAGANVNTADPSGRTVLMLASRTGQNSVVKTLIAAGADVNAVNKTGWTALMSASRTGQNSVVQTLIDAGANVNAVTKNGHTALTVASSSNIFDIRFDLNSPGSHDQVIQYLKDAGAH